MKIQIDIQVLLIILATGSFNNTILNCSK